MLKQRSELLRMIAATTLMIITTLLVFEFSSVDIWLQNFFFNEHAQQWIWRRSEPISRFFLYDGIKVALMALVITLIAALIFEKFSKQCLWSENTRLGLYITLLSLIIVPIVLAALKASSNVACPKDLLQFGGEISYIKLFERYSEHSIPTKWQRCFPAAHAGSGFSLMALFFLCKTSSGRMLVLIFSITLAWLMGFYKMAIGDHFFSHTLIAMELSWLLVCLVAVCLLMFNNRSRAFTV